MTRYLYYNQIYRIYTRKKEALMELSFGEQIKILLNRKHMTIKDLADL